MPGGHIQFQLWYWDLMPLMIEMVGLPSLLTFKLFHDIYPCNLGQPAVHHWFSLAVSLWLMFSGPDWFRRARRAEVKKEETKARSEDKAVKPVEKEAKDKK